MKGDMVGGLCKYFNLMVFNRYREWFVDFNFEFDRCVYVNCKWLIKGLIIIELFLIWVWWNWRIKWFSDINWIKKIFK